MTHDERAELVRRLFVLMTIKLEDAAGEAAAGQAAGQNSAEQIARAEGVELLMRDVGLVAERAAAIARLDSPI